MQHAARRTDWHIRFWGNALLSLLLGAAGAILLLTASLQATLLWGQSPRFSMGAMWGACLAVGILSPLLNRWHRQHPIAPSTIALALAGTSVLAWPTLAILDSLFTAVAPQLAAIPALEALTSLLAVLTVIAEFALFTFLSHRLPDTWATGRVLPWQPSMIASGALLGLFLVPSLGESLGFLNAQWLAAIFCTFILLPSLVPAWKSQPADHPASETSSSLNQASPVALGLAAIACGFLWTAWHRIAMQLILQTANFLVAESLGLCCGITLGLALVQLARRANWNAALLLRIALASTAVMAALTVSRFNSLISYTLWINTSISSPLTSSFLRLPLAALGSLIVGLIAALSLQAFSGKSPAGRARSLPLFFLLLVIAATSAQAALSTTGPAVWFILATFLLAIAALSVTPIRELLATRTKPLFAAATLATLVLGTLGFYAYQPAIASQVLFSSNIAMVRIPNRSLDTLRHLDDTRLMRQVEGEFGSITLWTRRGSQTQIRENGVPKGVASRDTLRHPHYSAEILAATLPMVLHEQAHDVLLLGLGSGSPLGALLAAPVQHLDCVEEDRTLIDVVKHTTTDPNWIDWHDDRLFVHNTSPLWWSRAQHNRYDLVLSNPEQSTLVPLASNFTREFYQSAARSLRPSGIFCQRFITFDYGPKPWEQALQTLRSTFDHTLAIDTAQGEVLLLATNDPRGIVREGFVKRLRAGQVSSTLASLGWDWALPLTLPSYGDAHLNDIISPATAINSARQGTFLFGWSHELSRWGLKSQELAHKLAGRYIKLGEWIPDEANHADVLRRLGEVKVQDDSIVKYPDQYWAYRKGLKEEVQKNPRTLIKQVAFESTPGEFDPEDKRRMAYIAALNTAGQTRTLEAIHQIKQYETPFDPLVSPFLHQEVAELYSRAGHPDPAAELTHRLHTIYYAGKGDRSVLYVVDAIQLVLEHPQALPDDAARWTHLDGLMQMLFQRWQVRGMGKPGVPRVMYRDAEKSLAAAAKALDWMQDHARDAGITKESCTQRRWVLEYSLVRPLRDYKQQLLPYLNPSDMPTTDSPPTLQGN